MTIQRANLGDLLAPGFREIFFQRFGERPPEYTDIFNMLTSKRQYEDDSYVSGFGLVPLKTEGASVTYDDIIQGFDRRYTHDTHALAYRITEEMFEDDLYNIMKQLPDAMGRSMRITIEQDGANFLNRAFNSSYTFGDGKEFLATDHPLLGGGTQKNELTNAADLNADTLEQAFIDIAATTDDRGLLSHLIPTVLIVAPANEYNARRLLNSTLDPDSANNAINPMQGALKLSVNHFLTDVDAWFIRCDQHTANWFWRVTPDHQQAQGNDFDTGDAKFRIRARWSRGASMPWGYFGSPGV